MKYAFDKDKLLEMLPQFREALRKMPHNEATCLLGKISLYLKEYVNENILKELDMAFVSIGQKYGFVSAGDVFRKRLADAEAKVQAEADARVQAETQKAEARAEADAKAKAEVEKLETARGLLSDGVSIDLLVQRFNLPKEQILGK